MLLSSSFAIIIVIVFGNRVQWLVLICIFIIYIVIVIVSPKKNEKPAKRI